MGLLIVILDSLALYLYDRDCMKLFFYTLWKPVSPVEKIFCADAIPVITLTDLESVYLRSISIPPA